MSPADSPPSPAPARQKHVLLAEDDENDVFFILRAFREAGMTYPVHHAPDGQEAIDYLRGAGQFANRDRHPFPVLLILDLKMPRKSGMHVLGWIRAQPLISALPVIILSSSANRFDIEKAYQLWVNAFLTKPVGTAKRNELAAMIKDFWLDLNQLPAICLDGLDAARLIANECQLGPSL